MVKLREYQEYSVNKFNEYKRKGYKNICIANPTGTGKTFISAAIASTYIENDEPVFFLAPRVNLVNQTAESFKHLGDIQIIQGSRKYDEDGLIYIASTATLVRRDIGISPALIIVDEAHFGYNGQSHKNIVNRFPNAIYLSLTATPFDPDGNPLKGFDKIIKYKNIQWYIDNKFLTPCECYMPVVPNLSKVRITAGEYNEKDSNLLMNTSSMTGNIIKKTKDRIRGKTSLFFAVTIAHAENVAAQYEQEGFRVQTYHSKIKNDIREQIIKDFDNSKIDILVSVAALVFGFDCPIVDCLIIGRPIYSKSFLRQLYGRGMRIFDGKKICWIYDCTGSIKNELPHTEVKPREKYEKFVKCKICSTKSKVQLTVIKKIDNKIMRLSTWECKNNHYFETEKEIKSGICKHCSRVIQNSKFRETENYEVFIKCECGEETIIRSIPKNNYKLKKIKSKINKESSKNNDIEGIDNFINNLKSEAASMPESEMDLEKIKSLTVFKNYIINIHHDLQYKCYSVMHKAIKKDKPIQDIQEDLMNAVIDSALEENIYDHLSPKLIKIAYKKTCDPANIISIHNSRSKKKMLKGWEAKTIINMKKYKKRNKLSNEELMTLVREKCQDITRCNQKMASLYYFFED